MARARSPHVPPCGADERNHDVKLSPEQRVATGGANRATLAAWRRAYGCDCCGDVERDETDPVGRPVRVHLKIIERITGHQPDTCPWRAFYEPIVQEVLPLSGFARNGNLAAAWGDDPAHLLVDAYSAYDNAKERTLAEDEKIAREKAERERKTAIARGRRAVR